MFLPYIIYISRNIDKSDIVLNIILKIADAADYR